MISTLKRLPTTQCELVNNPIDKHNYYVFNVSKGQDNWSQRKSPYIYQRNNLTVNAHSLCNVHMMAMGLIYSGIYDMFKKEIDLKYPEYPRFPDKLAKYIIESPEMVEYYKKRFPSFYKNFDDGVKNAYTLNEIHAGLSYGSNRFIDAGVVTYFSTNVHWKDIIDDLVYNRLPVGISGRFNNYDHMVLAVGVAYRELDNKYAPGENQIPDYFIVDDPYGKTYEYDKGLSGNDIWLPFANCVRDFKALGNEDFKMAHRFIRADNLGI